MSSDVLIRCENVSKKFCRDLKRSLWYGIKDAASDLLGGNRNGNAAELRTGEFWANQDISFELRRGECLGLIGRNGAGKTTLLKMLNGLIKPDEGRIEIRGHVGALIALGAGFNQVLTGRENIYTNASILGIPRSRIDCMINTIVEFADLQDFIDSPVRTYSSGMAVRLGFAIASMLNPDVLILDEVLAVGDSAFRYKCYRRIDDLRSTAAVVFVSHDIPSVARICDRVLLLETGCVAFDGASGPAIRKYNALTNQRIRREKTITCFQPVTDIALEALPDTIPFNMPLTATLRLTSSEDIPSFGVMINIRDAADQYLASFVLPANQSGLGMRTGQAIFRLDLHSIPLKPGTYRFSMSVTDSKDGLLAIWSNGHEFTVTGGNEGGPAYCQLDARLKRV